MGVPGKLLYNHLSVVYSAFNFILFLGSLNETTVSQRKYVSFKELRKCTKLNNEYTTDMRSSPETPKVPNCLLYYMYFLCGPWMPLKQSLVHYFQTTVTSSLYTYVHTLWPSQPGTIHFLIGKFSYFLIRLFYIRFFLSLTFPICLLDFYLIAQW